MEDSTFYKENPQEQVNVVDWLIEQMKQHRDVNSINPIELINLKYEAIAMYNKAMHEEFKRGLVLGRYA